MIPKETIIEMIERYDKITKETKDFSGDFKLGWHHCSVLLKSEIKNMFDLNFRGTKPQEVRK